MTYRTIHRRLLALATPKRKSGAMRFFKTAPGQYGYGDTFIGVTVPDVRRVAKWYRQTDRTIVLALLHSKIHEERLLALIILVAQYQQATLAERQVIYQLYLKNTHYINNWDLVDTSAGYIVGAHLFGKNTTILTRLAKSKNLWERRIAIIATFYFIMQGEASETLRIAKVLLHDEHDLIHKAVGWMLREVGKRCGQKTEEQFLQKYYQQMPRTMLRYAIEKFSKAMQYQYLHAKL